MDLLLQHTNDEIIRISIKVILNLLNQYILLWTNIILWEGIMSTIILVIIFIIGLGMIVKGGDMFVDSAVGIAEKTGISTGIIGATIVSVATTLPELFVSTLASWQGLSDMAVGNALGSYICNIALILGVCAMIRPIKIRGNFFSTKALLMILSLAIFYIFGKDGIIAYIEGISLLTIVILFIILNLMEHSKEKKKSTDKNLIKTGKQNTFKNIVFFVIGGTLVITGSNLLVDSAVEIAYMLKVPTQVISLTLVALGTSLPELVTALTATIKNQQNISVGNILGANILNISMIIGVSSLVSRGGLPVSNQTLTQDIPVAAFIALIFVGTGTFKKGISRLWGLVLLVLYLMYLYILF